MKDATALMTLVAERDSLRSQIAAQEDNDIARHVLADLDAAIAQQAPTQSHEDLAHELWAMAQLAPGEGIADGAARIAARLAQQAEPVANSDALERVIDEYLDEYEFCSEDASYAPNEDEHMLIKDAIMGLLVDPAFIAASRRGATPQSPAAQPSGWIRVSERLPDEGVPVLVGVGGVVRPAELYWARPGRGEKYTSYWYWSCPINESDGWEREDVTHWQPMLELPKKST